MADADEVAKLPPWTERGGSDGIEGTHWAWRSITGDIVSQEHESAADEAAER